MTEPLGDAATDERELTQLVKDLNEAVVKADVAALDRAPARGLRPSPPARRRRGSGAVPREPQGPRVDFESLVPDEITVRVYGDAAVLTGRSTAKGTDQYGEMDQHRRWTRVPCGATDAGSSSTSRRRRSPSP